MISRYLCWGEHPKETLLKNCKDCKRIKKKLWVGVSVTGLFVTNRTFVFKKIKLNQSFSPQKEIGKIKMVN